MNSNNRIAATLFPRDIICLRNISINTLHKGDDDGDDDDVDNNNNNNKEVMEKVHLVGPDYGNISCCTFHRISNGLLCHYTY